MIRALAIKELREIAGIAVVALAVNLAVVSNLAGLPLFTWLPIMPSGRSQVPLVGPDFLSIFGVVSAGCALALGFRQSAWEAGRGTYLFLLHRPLSRDTIFLTKLGTGLGVFLLSATLPVLMYAVWAATPGHHPSPFEWSMTRECWQLCLVLPALYLGAFLSGLRPARWVGTRLLPLAACGLVSVFLLQIPWWWLVGLPVTIGIQAVLVSSICYVGRERDY